jgi:hypothetical protein
LVLKKISEDTKNSMVQEKGADSINRKGAQSWHTEHVYNVETLYPTSFLYICFWKNDANNQISNDPQF